MRLMTHLAEPGTDPILAMKLNARKGSKFRRGIRRWLGGWLPRHIGRAADRLRSA